MPSLLRPVALVAVFTLSTVAAEGAIRNVATGVTYTTIQQAVDAAAAGQVIALDAGTYPESVTITKSLTLERFGFSSGLVLIEPPSGNGLTITGASVTVRDLRVSGAAGSGISASGGASHTLSLERVELWLNRQHGLSVSNYLSVTINQGSYNNNDLHGIHASTVGTLQINSTTAAQNLRDGIRATGVSTAFNVSLTAVNGNSGEGIVASNSPRAGTATLSHVLSSGAGGSGGIAGFNNLTVGVTGSAATSADQLVLTSTAFIAQPGGVHFGSMAYSDIGTLTFDLYGGNDTVTINSTASGTSTIVNAGDGNDTVTVGGGNLDGIVGALSVIGGSGTDDAMTVSDTNETTPTSYTITASSIGRRFATGITYTSTIDRITLNTTAHADDLWVEGTTAARVDVNLQAGNDSMNFAANGASLSGGNVVGGDGHDRVDYFGYTSPVAVSLSNDLLIQGTLSQSQVVPPSGSTATGGVVMVFTTLGAFFDMRIGINNLSAKLITGQHIHPAAAGVNEPSVAVDLGAVGAWQTVGSSIVKVVTGVGFPSGSVSALTAGQTYLDVHNQGFPGGAVRAQLAITVPANSATGTGGISSFESARGGSGNDLLLGSDEGVNDLQGQGGNDLIFGRGGNDSIIGGPGDDLLFGDGGDDLFQWSSGQGSDTVEGGAGTDRLIVNGSATENDAFAIRMNGTRVTLGHTNLTAASLDLNKMELLHVHGRGCDEAYKVEPLVGVATDAFGGAGNDTLVYDALCASVAVSATEILHPTRGVVSGLADMETKTFVNRTVITPEAPSFPSGGGNGVLSIATGTSCAWTAAVTATDRFLQITAGTAGTGTGSVSYRVIPNVLVSARIGSITVAGGVVTIQQNAAGMSPNSPFDLNGDGAGDLLIHNSFTGDIAAWFMNKRVLIEGSVLGEVPDRQWQVAGMGDFNADGKADILWQRTDDGRLAVWLMDGTTRLDVLPLSPDRMPDPTWKVRAVGDMNGDSKPDLIIQNTVSGLVGVWHMDGLTQIDGRLFDPDHTSTDWTIVGAADFNADGKRDLVFQHTVGTLAAWFMDGATRLDVLYFTPELVAEASWRVKGIMDVNADGHPDLLMQHLRGSIGAFMMNGTTLIDGVLFVPPLALGWRLVGPR